MSLASSRSMAITTLVSKSGHGPLACRSPPRRRAICTTPAPSGRRSAKEGWRTVYEGGNAQTEIQLGKQASKLMRVYNLHKEKNLLAVMRGPPVSDHPTVPGNASVLECEYPFEVLLISAFMIYYRVVYM